MNEQILRVLVGSHAHGLATPESDYDYRGVFVVPTQEILRLGGNPKTTNWIEGNIDDTSWEIGHFLHLATHCNPTILETFLAPDAGFKNNVAFPRPGYVDYGEELRALFPLVWNSRGVRDAFIGYGLNQRKKFLEDKDGRPNKFAAAYLRSLYNAYELLTTGSFTVRIANTKIGETVRRFKMGEYESKGEVIDACEFWEKQVRQAFDANPGKTTDHEAVNEFLLKVRKAYWV